MAVEIMHVPPLAKSFDLKPYLGRWIHWSRIAPCFFPGRGRRAAKIDPELAPIRDCGGVYVMIWEKSPGRVLHTDRAVVYIGETANFGVRMADWAWSAGFWGKRKKGHSAAWRWKEGAEHFSVAFFVVEPPVSKRLAKHVRVYYEIIGTEEYRSRHGQLPRANEWEELDKV